MVYFVRSGASNGPVKIGFCIRTSQIRLKGDQRLESYIYHATSGGQAALQKLFEDYSIGNDWFRSSKPLTKIIAAAAEDNFFEPDLEEVAIELKALNIGTRGTRTKRADSYKVAFKRQLEEGSLKITRVTD